jgi:hypothetical protein
MLTLYCTVLYCTVLYRPVLGVPDNPPPADPKGPTVDLMYLGLQYVLLSVAIDPTITRVIDATSSKIKYVPSQRLQYTGTVQYSTCTVRTVLYCTRVPRWR